MDKVMIGHHPLAGRAFANGRVSVVPAGDARRLSLRAGANAVAALSKALGVKLPVKPKTTATKHTRTAFWLGPDEWLVIDTSDGDPVADCAKVKQLHSAVDVSSRNVAIEVSGAGAIALLNSGCPLDLHDSMFPVGAATRTIFGKAEIVLWRQADDAWRIECWRSFSDYVFAFLEDAACDRAV